MEKIMPDTFSRFGCFGGRSLQMTFIANLEKLLLFPDIFDKYKSCLLGVGKCAFVCINRRSFVLITQIWNINVFFL